MNCGQIFYRGRIGIYEVISARDQKALEEGLSLSAEAVVCVMHHGVETAMQAYHGVKPAL